MGMDASIQGNEDTWFGRLMFMQYHGGYLVRRNVTIPSSSQSGSSITSERERDECPINEQDPARLGEQHGHDDMCVAELHVLFSQVFNVPVMYFNIYQPDGMLVMRGDLLERMPELQTASSWANLTQAEHPVLGLPFFLLHPCNTQGFMNTLLPQATCSSNMYLHSWISLVETSLQLPPSSQSCYGCYQSETS
eukprot:TRINITY_DN6025_c0_g1_i21.p1 TRINITY_DN6025_c0_g1~~TRINITY_DN6025_c0_g1_i21.p1  ORF type:complete len:193 (-),score=34.72 TRINITY_DN6025_c0_g1_i21:453-1031(-)